MSVADPTGFDPWLLKADDYSPEKFYTRSVDEKGHREKIWQVQFPPHILAAMNGFVGQRYVGEYRTVADLLRDAAYHRLRWLNEAVKDGVLQRTLDLEAVAVEIEQATARIQENERVVGAARELVEKAFRTGDRGEMQRFIGRMEELMGQLEQPYQGQMKGHIEYARESLKRMIGFGS